jgi:hypothetical protein
MAELWNNFFIFYYLLTFIKNQIQHMDYSMPPAPPPPPSGVSNKKGEIKVVPFIPQVTDVNPANAAATQLQQLISTMQSEGWEYVSLSSLQTAVKPTGCGSNKNQIQLVNYQLLIFRR